MKNEFVIKVRFKILSMREITLLLRKHMIDVLT